MSDLKHKALSLCRGVLRDNSSQGRYEMECIEFKEAMVKLASLGRYGDIRVVMNEFEDACRYHNLKAEQSAFLASVIPLSIDTACHLLMSPEAATVIVGNILENECYTRDGHYGLSDLIENLIESKYEAQACALMDGLIVAFQYERDTLMPLIMTAVHLAVTEHCPMVNEWLQQHDKAIASLYTSADRCSDSVREGIDLFEIGAETFGLAMINKMYSPEHLELLEAEELTGVSPTPYRMERSPVKDQGAYITYIMGREDLTDEWLDMKVDLDQFKPGNSMNLADIRIELSKEGRVASKNSIDLVCAVLLSNAKNHADIDIVKKQMKLVGGYMKSPFVLKAIEKVIPIITEAEAEMGVPAILLLHRKLDIYDLINYEHYAEGIRSRLDDWIPTAKIDDVAEYISCLDKFEFDRKALGALIDHNWNTMSPQTSTILLDKAPKSIALASRYLKGHYLEMELGM